jgi:hypothetical protein
VHGLIVARKISELAMKQGKENFYIMKYFGMIHEEILCCKERPLPRPLCYFEDGTRMRENDKPRTLFGQRN